MKRVLIVITLALFSSVAAKAERVSSDCTAPDSVVKKYKTDAQRNALSRIFWFNSPYKDSADIPAMWTDTILRALIAVYNAPLPKTDTVDGVTINIMDIHGRPYQTGDTFAIAMNGFGFIVDTSQQWVKDLKQNIFPTSDAQVNAFFHKYKIKSTAFSIYMSFGALETEENYNMTVLTKEWAKISGVQSIEKTFIIGDGNYLVVPLITPDFVEIIYSYGYGDCPAGCTGRKNWRYRVYYNCDVEFLESWEGPLKFTPPPPVTGIPGCIAAPAPAVFPNPFNDYINLPYDADYSIINIMGRVVKKGVSVNNRIEQLQNLPSGVYSLILQKDGDMKKQSIVKE